MYSTCCGEYSDFAPEIDICPKCREHADWVEEDDFIEENDDES